MVDPPLYVERSELDRLLAQEEKQLGAAELEWWLANRVEPYVASSTSGTHFVVAVTGARAVVFFDDEDEFGCATLVEPARVEDCGLAGDLVDAIRVCLHSYGT
jgi:hypothetical protein